MLTNDFRQRILANEEISDEEMNNAIIALREARSSGVAPRKKAAPKIDPNASLESILGDDWKL